MFELTQKATANYIKGKVENTFKIYILSLEMCHLLQTIEKLC